MKNTMLVYHGTCANFTEIDLSIENDYNEFGRGFYVSTDYSVAKHKSTYLMKRPLEDEPRVMTFELDLNDLKVNDFGGQLANQDWLDVVATKDTADYDIIWGKAVDELGVNNEYLSKYILARRKGDPNTDEIGETLVSMLLKDPEDQMCLKTPKAIEHLRLLDVKLL